MEDEGGEEDSLDQLAVLSDVSSDNHEVAIAKLLNVDEPTKHDGQTKRIKHKSKVKKHYYTNRGKPGEDSSDIKVGTSPFQYPEDLAILAHDILTKAWRNDERIKQLKVKCINKSTKRKKRDFQMLHVKDPPKDSMKTVCDVDPHYFKMIESKPEKLNIKDYIQTLRDSLRTKIVNGYREDDILLMDESLRSEHKMLHIIQENYQKYVNIFEEFLYRDHMSAMQLLNDSEMAAAEAYEEYLEYKNVAKKLSALRSTLFIAEEKWRNIKVYQKFLYTVSPASWKASQPKYRRASCLYKEESEDDINIFGTYRESITWRNISLEDIIDNFYNESRTERPPEIYFTEPDQLLDVFRFLESQNLNALLHYEEMRVPMLQVKEGLESCKKFFENHIKSMQDYIEKLQVSILWEEERESYLKDLIINLLNNQFRKIIMDEEVLNLQIFVEDVYETRIGANTANLQILDMMTEIENKYRNELLYMDETPSIEVSVLEHTYFQEEIRIMKLAQRAAKQFAELEKIILRVKKSYDPPWKKPAGKQVKQRSPIKDTIEDVASLRHLTTTEDEYLEYFTDYCHSTDDSKKLEMDIERDLPEDCTPSYFKSMRSLPILEAIIISNA